MDVYWFEQSLTDVPERDDWLGDPERLRLSALRFPKRREEWRLGRWTAKCAVALYLHLPILSEVLSGIEICTTPSGAPAVMMPGLSRVPAISLSHRCGGSACALTDRQARLGCDLEVIEPRDKSFAQDYFTRDEQDLVTQTHAIDQPRLVSLLWSAKESALKALNAGLRLDTRSVMVSLQLNSASGWTKLYVASSSGELFQGWWRQADNMVQTVVADTAFSPPVSLQPSVDDRAGALAPTH